MATHPTNLEQERSVPEAYDEGLRYFMGEGTINKTLTRLANDLEQRGIDHMVIRAIALLAHGYPSRFVSSGQTSRSSSILMSGQSISNSKKPLERVNQVRRNNEHTE